MMTFSRDSMNDRRHHFGRRIVPAIGLGWLIWIVGGLAGCLSPSTNRQAMVELPPNAPPGAIDSLLTQNTLPPDPTQAIERFNQAHGATSLWSRVELRIRWLDEKSVDESGSECGSNGGNEGGGSQAVDGHLMARFPDRLAISLNKLGHELLWAGCDPDRYWVIDLMADGGPLAYLGGTGSPASRSSAAGLLPIRPDQLPWLLGGAALNHAKADSLSMQPVNGYWLIQPQDVPVRILMDPLTGQAARIDWIDAATGLPSIIALPGRYQAIAGSGDAGSLATRWEIFIPGRRTRLSVNLTDLEDGSVGHRIRWRLFDVNDLLDRHFKVPADRRIDLQKPAGR